MATKTPRMPSRVKVELPGLRRSREARGLSQKELEKLAEVSFITISRIENGHLDTTMGTAKKLARALRVKVEELRTDDATFVVELEREIEEKRDRYYRHFEGGEALDLAHEEDLAEAYADLALARGGKRDALRDVLLEAIKDGKQRGLIISQEERSN